MIRRLSIAAACLALAVSGCRTGQVAPTATALPATTTSETSTPAPTTIASPTIAAMPLRAFSSARLGASVIPPLDDRSDMLGSGCAPGPGVLPDGAWFGWIDSISDETLQFDLACLAPGVIATNTNPTLRTVPIDAGFTIMLPNGATAMLETWTHEHPVWLFVNGGQATEAAEVTVTIVLGSGWTVAEVALPVGGGCCGENYHGPASPPGPYSADLPDGVYAVWIESHAPHQLTLSVMPFVTCEDDPDLCNPDALAGDVGVDPDQRMIRTVALDTTTEVRMRGITPPEGDANTVTGIAGTGAELDALLIDLQAEWDTWVMPSVEGSTVASGIEQQLLEFGSTDLAFPFGSFDGYGADAGPLAYRGPLGINLVTWLGPEPPLLSWSTQLEIRDGTVVLIIDAGQIAG